MMVCAEGYRTLLALIDGIPTIILVPVRVCDFIPPDFLAALL